MRTIQPTKCLYHKLGQLHKDSLLVTIDVVSLYTNIPHKDGIRATKYALEKRQSKEPKTWVLLRLLHFILTKTAFKFNDKFYEQISGTTMGTKCAPSYSILFMDKLERDFLSTSRLIPLVWWRFIDDIFMIWQHSHEELCSFLDALNSFHETIKFTAEISDISVNFLDKEGNLSTDLYTKPTDSHLYLHYSSYHPKHQKDSLPYSQALRLRRICSTDNLYKTASENLLQNFKYRGYPTQLVRSAINKAFSRNRDDLLQPKKPISTQKSIIPFITSNNPLNPPIRKILSKYTCIQETSEDLKSVLDNKIMVVNKRATNIKQMLVRADITPQDINKGSSPCGKPCIICPFMAKTEQITSWKTKEQFRIKGRFNCKTKNVIYIISCKKCGLQYVGQSGNTFN